MLYNQFINKYILQAANVPVDFESFFFSEVNPTLSAPIEEVVASITNNKICIKVFIFFSLIQPSNTSLLKYGPARTLVYRSASYSIFLYTLFL